MRKQNPNHEKKPEKIYKPIIFANNLSFYINSQRKKSIPRFAAAVCCLQSNKLEIAVTF